MDNADIECLVPDWLDRLHEIIKKQEDLVMVENEFYMPFIAIPTSIIAAIFKMTEYLELGSDTKYLTIHLYDKFMCNNFWVVYKEETVNGLTEAAWSQVCKKISKQSKLYLMSCLQIASKMDSHSKSLGISQIINVLKWMDKKCEYMHSSILSSEFKVFKMVGFKMPLCTPLHCIEVLLAATNLTNMPNIYDVVINLLDFTYLEHEKLYSRLQCLAQGHVAETELEKKNVMTLETNVLFLGASVVLCGTFLLCIKDKAARVIASKLADLIDIKDNDIWDMADILFSVVIQE
ncbi:hypothetical protein KM043_012451 [Ampulex compressa]|nr:hypothetical protein KM043_012451 [Ampulex compressa]